jgi:hypothetical protein
MRTDGISSLKEALAHAGLDSRPSYVAPRVMAERFRHRPQARPAKFPLGGDERSGVRAIEIVWAKTWFLVVLVLMSALLAGAFLLGKKSRAVAVAPCYVEANAEFLSI